MFFGHVQKLMFVGVHFRSCFNVKVCQRKIFLSCSNQNSVILIWSSEPASPPNVSGKSKKDQNDFLDPSEKKIIDCSVLADAILVHNLLDNIATLFFY